MIRFSRRRRGRAAASTFQPQPARAAQPRRTTTQPGRAPSALGDVPHPVTLDVRQLQNSLVRAGYNIGPTGVDGRWGNHTMNALKRFIQAEFDYTSSDIETLFEVDTGTQVLIVSQNIWDRLRTVEPGSGGEEQERRPRTSQPSSGGSTSEPSTSSPDQSMADDFGEEESLWKNPWLWGSVALVSAAGLAYWLSRDDEEDELEDEELLPAF